MDYSQVIRDLYTSKFGRAADAGGLDYWNNMLSTGQIAPADLAKIFADTEEGVNYASNQNFVKDTYMGETGRPYDEQGLKFWADKLQSGEIGRDQLGQAFSATPEGQIYDLYMKEFYRSSAEDPGSAFWLNRLNEGATYDEVAKALAESPEARVQDAYQKLFGRVGEQEGVKHWMGALGTENLSQQALEKAMIDAAKKTSEPVIDKAALDAANAADAAKGMQRTFTPAEMSQYYSYGQRPEHQFYATRT
jgi:hypothetical protein